MDKYEIKKANRRALPRFLLVMVISFAVGGALGFFSEKLDAGALSGGMAVMGEQFGMHVAPWLLLGVAVILPAVSVPLYRRTRRLLSGWDGEDESLADAVDEKLSIIIWLTSAALIVSFFLIAAQYSSGTAVFEGEGSATPFLIGVTAFLAILIESVLIQQKCVDASKQINPEKTASVYDMRFQKKWMDSCDEAERMLVGKCAYKAYSATNTVCVALAVVLAICALTFEIGFLPSLAVCMIWLVNQSVYCKEAIAHSKAGRRIS